MFVKFIGPGEISFEYNAKRFFFNKETPPRDIPAQVYDHVKGSRTVESSYLVPCDAPGSQSGSNSELVKEVNDLKSENKKLLDRIEHLQKQNIEHKKKK